MKSTTKKNNAQLNQDFSFDEITAISKRAYEEAVAVTWRQAEVGRTLTQNEKIAFIDDKTLVIGADVGSEKHDIRAFDNRGREFSKKAFEFPNNEAGFEEAKAWIFAIRDDMHLEKIVVGLEPTGHYWFNLTSWLMDKDITVVLVNASRDWLQQGAPDRIRSEAQYREERRTGHCEEGNTLGNRAA